MSAQHVSNIPVYLDGERAGWDISPKTGLFAVRSSKDRAVFSPAKAAKVLATGGRFWTRPLQPWATMPSQGAMDMALVTAAHRSQDANPGCGV